MGNCSQYFQNPSPLEEAANSIQLHEYQSSHVQQLDPQTRRLLTQIQAQPGNSQFLGGKQLKKRKGKDQYYKGEWSETIRKGKGVYFVPGKFIYVGQFDDKPTGYGKFTSFQHKIAYEGNLKDGKITDKGKLRHLDGQFTFEGIVENGRPTYGTLVVFNPDTKERQFTVELQNYPTNKAIINYGDYKKYEGEINIRTFLPEGQGVMTYPNNTIYDGEWNAGEYNGKGKFSWSDGSSYFGDYLKGKKHGLGRFTYASQKYYEGGWVNGKQEGEGALFSPEGNLIQKGKWREGVYQPEHPVQKQAEHPQQAAGYPAQTAGHAPEKAAEKSNLHQ